MKKKQVPKLPDPVFTFDDTAIVMLQTRGPAYQLAIQLNEAYNLQLARIDDIEIDYTPFPCFFFHDEPAWLAYILIARTGDIPAFADYDKIPLIRGRDAWRFQQTIYDDIHSRRYGMALGPATEPDASDLLEHYHWEQLNQLSDTIHDIDIFGFSRRRPIVSTMRLTNDAPTLFPVEESAARASEQRAIAAYHKLLQSFLTQFFDALHSHLAVEEEL